MDKFLAYSFRTKESFEILQAYLQQLDVEALQEEEDRVIAYIKSTEMKLFESALDELEQKIEFEVSKAEVPNKNWNAEWESSFEPVIVDDFCCIKADFHKIKPAVNHLVTINPKMSFGTGHHETTYMMVQEMSKLNFLNKSVFDFGTGTGLLAILSEMLGADQIKAIDNDPMAIENSLENKKRNKQSRVVFKHADQVIIPDSKYDIVLANINRQVLLDNARALSFVLNKKGTLLISGILLKDKELIVNIFVANGFIYQDFVSKGEWLCLNFTV